MKGALSEKLAWLMMAASAMSTPPRSKTAAHAALSDLIQSYHRGSNAWESRFRGENATPASVVAKGWKQLVEKLRKPLPVSPVSPVSPALPNGKIPLAHHVPMPSPNDHRHRHSRVAANKADVLRSKEQSGATFVSFSVYLESPGDSPSRVSTDVRRVIAGAAGLSQTDVSVTHVQKLASGGTVVDVEAWFDPTQAVAAGAFTSALYERARTVIGDPDLEKKYGRLSLSGVRSQQVAAEFYAKREAFRTRRVRAVTRVGDMQGRPGGTAVPRHANPQRGVAGHWRRLDLTAGASQGAGK